MHFSSSTPQIKTSSRRHSNSIERLAGCISPTIEHNKAQILGEKLEMATKLIFPSLEREPDQPLDLHTEVFVSHRGVFLDIGQFSVYVARFIKPKQRPLYPLYMDGETVTFCRMPTTPRPSPRI